MGGDFAPQKTVHGAILAQNELPDDTSIILFGKKSDILSVLSKHNCSNNQFEIVDCVLEAQQGIKTPAAGNNIRRIPIT